MLKASSLGNVLCLTRLPRHTFVQSLWTKSNDPSSEVGELPRQQSSGTGASKPSLNSVTSQSGSADAHTSQSGGNSPRQKYTVFQLPDPVSVRSHLPRHLVRQQPRDYPVGNPWRKLPLPIVHRKVIRHGQTFLAGREDEHDDPFDDLDLALLWDKERSLRNGVDKVAWRRDLLRVLGNTQSHLQGWMAYRVLVSVPFSIPHRHLNRFVRLIARERTKTRALFARLLAILTTIHRSGWNIEAYQWNALIDNAGKGLRRARPKDFKTAFDIFIDMVSSKPPRGALSRAGSSLDEAVTDNPLPDVYTYTTLINHAANARNQVALAQATSLLTASGIRPNRITHLVLLKFYSNSTNLDGVRATLARICQQNQELGIDGVNACIWAFSRHNRLDIVLKIYRVLRHNVLPEADFGPNDIYSAKRALLQENMEIKASMFPNAVTYISIVQAAAYHGNLRVALAAFRDMLSSENVEIGAPMYRDEHGKLKPSPYSPTLPIFRAIFLGFYRHGVARPLPRNPNSAWASDNSQPWVIESLDHIFDVFLALPEYIQPSSSTIYWALVAFDKTSSGDRELLRTAWNRIEDRFGGSWGAAQHRLLRIRRSLFDESESEFGSRRPRTKPG